MEKIEQINYYLNGKLSPEEMKVFESNLNLDESLRNQLENEKVIKEAISRSRTLELKARMDGLNPNSGISNYIKIAASLILLGGISGGAYYYSDANKPENSAKKETSNLAILNKPTIESSAQKNEALKEESIKDEPKQPIAKKIDKKDELNNEVVSPSIAEHQIDESTPGEFLANDDKTTSFESSASVKTPKTDVQLILNHSDELKYKHFNSKLYLIGKFDKKYEIIELRANEIYLNYNSSFFYLRDNIESPTKLEKVRDIQLLKQLSEKTKDHSK